jgi:hypothetical protein
MAGSAPRSGRGGRRFKSCHSDQLSRRSDHLRGQLCGTKLTGDNLAPPIHAAFIGATSVGLRCRRFGGAAHAPMRRRLPPAQMGRLLRESGNRPAGCPCLPRGGEVGELVLSSVICITRTQARGEYSRLVPPHLTPAGSPVSTPSYGAAGAPFVTGFGCRPTRRAPWWGRAAAWP